MIKKLLINIRYLKKTFNLIILQLKRNHLCQYGSSDENKFDHNL